MSLETPDSRPITADEIILAVGGNLNNDEIDAEKSGYYLAQAVKDLNQDPEALEFYRAVLLDGDIQHLKSETKKHIQKMKELVQPGFLSLLKTRGYLAIKETIRERQRIAEFLAYAKNLKPVRHDLDLTIDEFRSPKALGLKNGSQGYDLPVAASHYVYATSDQIAHPMGNIRHKQDYINEIGDVFVPKDHGYRYLDEADIVNRAEIVMMDIADVGVCTRRLEKSAILTYLNNVFDYEGGKEILGYYLAYVFEDLDDANRFLSQNCTRECAEAWQKDYGFDQNRLSDLGSHFRYWDENGEMVSFEDDTTGWLRRIQKRMREVFDATGILPPLELEIRIRDHAKIKEGC